MKHTHRSEVHLTHTIWCLGHNGSAFIYLCQHFRELIHSRRNVNLDIDIFVISELKWLKFGLQAHLFKMFGYAKFQLSIFFTLRVMKLLVEVFSDFH